MPATKPIATITKNSDFPVCRKVRREIMEEGDFVRENCLGNLAGNDRYMLLFFKTHKESKRFGDTPVMGGESYKPISFTTQGPYNQASEVKDEQREHTHITEKVVKRFVSFDDLPVSVHAFYMQNFGLRGELGLFLKAEELEKLQEAKEKIRQRIRQIASELNDTDSRLTALVDNCLVDYDFYGDRFGHDSTYVSILGRDREGVEGTLAKTEAVRVLTSELYFHFLGFERKDDLSQYLSVGEIPFSVEEGTYGFFQNNRDKIIL